jgi:hypothetical protein
MQAQRKDEKTGRGEEYQYSDRAVIKCKTSTVRGCTVHCLHKRHGQCQTNKLQSLEKKVEFGVEECISGEK